MAEFAKANENIKQLDLHLLSIEGKLDKLEQANKQLQGKLDVLKQDVVTLGKNAHALKKGFHYILLMLIRN